MKRINAEDYVNSQSFEKRKVKKQKSKKDKHKKFVNMKETLNKLYEN